MYTLHALQEKEIAFADRPYSMSVELSEPGVNLKWLKNNAIIHWPEVADKMHKKDEIIDGKFISSIFFPNCDEVSVGPIP